MGTELQPRMFTIGVVHCGNIILKLMKAWFSNHGNIKPYYGYIILNILYNKKHFITEKL